MDDDVVDVCITSPPYWGLRDYGVDGQIGLEKHPSEYINHLVQVCREIKRVLKKSGSFYLNLGDTYCGSGMRTWDVPDDYKSKQVYFMDKGKAVSSKVKNDGGWLQPKQLMLIPVRVACALQDDGWILRNDIIWHKPNPMPSSVRDRLNCTYEHVFHFVKSRKYYYNLDNIRVPHTSIDDLKKRKNKYWTNQVKIGGTAGQVRGRCREDFYSENGKNPGDVICPDSWGTNRFDEYQGIGKQNPKGQSPSELKKQIIESYKNNPKGKNPGDVMNQPYAVQQRDKPFIDYRNLQDIKEFSIWLNDWRKQQGITIDMIESDMDSQAPHHWFNGESYPSVDDWKQFKSLYNPPLIYDEMLLTEFTKPSNKINNPKGKNPGDVVKHPVYGEDKGNRGRTLDHLHQQGEHHYHNSGKNPGDFWDITTKPFTSYNDNLEHFAVFPEELIIKPLKASCPKNGVVLDPFCGRGTVGKIAKQLGLNYILFDIKPEYCELAKLYINGQKRKIIENQTKLGVGS